VLVNGMGFDHGNLVSYASPPHIIIFAVDDNFTAPTGTTVKIAKSLPPSPLKSLLKSCQYYLQHVPVSGVW
jgi:hypothetical protein